METDRTVRTLDAWVEGLKTTAKWTPKEGGHASDPSLRSVFKDAFAVYETKGHKLPVDWNPRTTQVKGRTFSIGPPEVLWYKPGDKSGKHMDRPRKHLKIEGLVHCGTLIVAKSSKNIKGGDLIVYEDVVDWKTQSYRKDVSKVAMKTEPEWQEAFITRGALHEVTPIEQGERIAVKLAVFVRPQKYDGPKCESWHHPALPKRFQLLVDADRMRDLVVKGGGTKDEARKAWDTTFADGVYSMRQSYFYCD